MAGGDLSIYPSQEVHVPKGPLRASKRASTFFLSWRGNFFFAFFFLDRVGELAAAAEEEKVFWFFLYLSFFWRGRGRGRFGTAAADARPSLALSFFLSRAGEFGRWKREDGREKEKRERRERQYKVYFPTIFFQPQRAKEKRREERREKDI